MIYFTLAVLFTVSLYAMMRIFPKYRIDTFQAIIFNYFSCVLVGSLLTPQIGEKIQAVDWTSTGTLATLLLGIMFVIVFLLIGKTTQKLGVGIASLAGNMSLVIPVLFGLFVFHNNNKELTFLNYSGLVVAVMSLLLGVYQSGSERLKIGNVMIWPILYFIVSGANNTLINYLSATFYEPSDSSLFMIIACMGAVLIGSILLVINRVRILSKSLVAGLLLGVPNFLSLYFLLKAFNSFGNSAAFVFPIYNILTMIVSMILGALVYKEKFSKINGIGFVLAIVAILLLSYQEIGL